MGLTPTSSALAHVQLIPTVQVPVTATPSAAITPPTTGTPATAVATVTPASAITPASTQIGRIFLGEGICPLPEHIRKKILNLEYVDMADLRPESWLMASDTDNANNSLASLFRRRKQPVTDIAVWVQCYSSLVSVLVELYPQFIKHFMAYLSTIVMGAKRTRTLSWVAYDAAYRRKAAATKSLFWGTVDQYLYTVWFSNQAMGPACITCFSTDSATTSCHCEILSTSLSLIQALTTYYSPHPQGVSVFSCTT